MTDLVDEGEVKILLDVYYLKLYNIWGNGNLCDPILE